MVQDCILRETSLKRKTVTIANTAFVDIRLDNKTISYVIMALQILAHTYHGKHHFMTWYGRIFPKVSGDARMFFTKPDQFNIGWT